MSAEKHIPMGLLLSAGSQAETSKATQPKLQEIMEDQALRAEWVKLRREKNHKRFSVSMAKLAE